MNTQEITARAKLILREWDQFMNLEEQALRLAIAELMIESIGDNLNQMVSENNQIRLDCCDHNYESGCDCCAGECVRCSAE